jgi:hypothetical protein
MYWHLLDMSDESGETDHLLVGMSQFQPVNPERDADLSSTDWLEENAPHSENEVWLLTDGRTIAAYHTAGSGSCILPDETVVESLHTSQAARAREHLAAERRLLHI